MAEIKRQQIINTIRTRLMNIRKTNGYNTDAGLNIYNWPAFNFTVNNLPALTIKDTKNDVIQTLLSNYQDKKLTIEIEAISNKKETDKELREILNDITKAIGIDDTLDNLVIKIDFEGDTIEISQDAEAIGKATIIFSIYYRTQLWET